MLQRAIMEAMQVTMKVNSMAISNSFLIFFLLFGEVFLSGEWDIRGLNPGPMD